MERGELVPRLADKDKLGGMLEEEFCDVKVIPSARCNDCSLIGIQIMEGLAGRLGKHETDDIYLFTRCGSAMGCCVGRGSGIV